MKSDVNENSVQTVRQEITRSGSHNEIDTKETEITEVTETIEGGTVTTVKRKVVTVTQGKEEVVEDSQILLDENHTAFSSVVDSGFVVVEKEDTGDSLANTTNESEEKGSISLYQNKFCCPTNRARQRRWARLAPPTSSFKS